MQVVRRRGTFGTGRAKTGSKRSMPTCSTPIELIKATVDGMMDRGFGRIVNITSSAVKAPIDILGLSNGARSGLTGFVAGIARKTVRRTSRSTTCCPGRSTRTSAGDDEGHGKGERPYVGGSYWRSASERIRPAALEIRRSSERRARSFVQRASGLHHRPKPTIGWRSLPRYILKR